MLDTRTPIGSNVKRDKTDTDVEQLLPEFSPARDEMAVEYQIL